VLNTSQLATAIAKIKAYESAPTAARQAILLADIPSAAGDFPADIGVVQNQLAGKFATQTIVPGDSTAMRSLLLSNLNSGGDLVCYLGHGGSDRLGNSGYLTSADVPALASQSRLPFVSAITCLCGFFAEPGYDCLAETMVLAPQKGAIAMMSASGFSLDNEAAELNLGLAKSFVSGQPGRIGDFVRQAMADYNQSPRFTPAAMYSLLGDPALLYRGATLPAPVVPRVSNLSPQGNGSILLSCVAQPGAVYELRASTNAALSAESWTVIATGTVPFGPFALSILTTNFPKCFYRLTTH